MKKQIYVTVNGIQLNNKKEPNFKMAKGSEQTLDKEDMKMEKKPNITPDTSQVF